jgi:hypothetical protein
VSFLYPCSKDFASGFGAAEAAGASLTGGAEVRLDLSNFAILLVALVTGGDIETKHNLFAAMQVAEQFFPFKQVFLITFAILFVFATLIFDASRAPFFAAGASFAAPFSKRFPIPIKNPPDCRNF